MATLEGSSVVQQPIVVCTDPDICKKGDDIVAYFIIALELDNATPSANVNFKGGKASNNGTRISRVYGDDPGDAGIRSGCVMGWCRPVKNMSSTVNVNKLVTVREGTKFLMNCNGPEGPANTVGKLVYMTGGPLGHFNSDGTIDADGDPQLAKWRDEALAGSENIAYDNSIWNMSRHARKFGDAFSGAVRQATGTAMLLTEGGMRAYQVLSGEPITATLLSPQDRYLLTQDMVSAGNAMQGFLEAPYDTSVLATTEALEMIANGEIGTLAGGAAAGVAMGGATGAVRVPGLGGGSKSPPKGGPESPPKPPKNDNDGSGDDSDGDGDGGDSEAQGGGDSGGDTGDGVRLEKGAPLDPDTEKVLRGAGIDPDGEVYRTVDKSYLQDGKLPAHDQPMAQIIDVQSEIPNPLYQDGINSGISHQELVDIGINPTRHPIVNASSLANPNGYNVASTAGSSAGYAAGNSVTVAIQVPDLINAGGVFYPDFGAAISGAIYVTVPPGTALPITIVTP